MKLTAKTVAGLTLPADRKDVIYFDEDVPGFGLRLQGSKRVWIVQYKTGARQRRMTLGAVSAIPLVKARTMAADVYARVRLGQDPAGEKSDRRTADTFGGLAVRYLEWQRGRLRPRTYANVTRYLMVNAKPLHSHSVEEIHRRDVAGLLASLTARNAVRAYLSSFFSWAMREGLCEANPVIGTHKPELKSRERVLSTAELASIWKAADPADDYGAIVRLLILSGQRREEIGGLLWQEVGPDAITLPPPRTKNKREHVIPLSEPARAIISSRHIVVGRERVFSTPTWSRAKAWLDAKVSISPSWVLHDIRRSVATGLGDIGVLPHVVEAVLNHVSGHKAGVAGVYNKATYLPEKREALRLWADHLEAVVKGEASNVTPLRVTAG
jgi:integrase